MKNNYLKYGLLAVVALIWGKIIIDFTGLFGEDEDQAFLPEEVIKPTKKSEESVNTYKLVLDYKDPFLGNTQSFRSAEPKMTNPVNLTTTVNKQTKPTKEPKVTYKGLVKNKNSSKKIGLLMIDGKSYLVSNNNKYDKLNVLYFDANKLKYSFNGKVVEVEK